MGPIDTDNQDQASVWIFTFDRKDLLAFPAEMEAVQAAEREIERARVINARTVYEVLSGQSALERERIFAPLTRAT